VSHKKERLQKQKYDITSEQHQQF